jgi:putative peptidoglycan lipid II flippase
VLYMPVALSLIVSLVGIVIDRNLASRVGEQTIAWMVAATRLREFPLGLVSTAVSMAVLPALSRLDLSSNREQFKATLGLGLRLVLMLIVPAAVGLLVLRVPIISLIFEHGEFTSFDTSQTARALRFYLLGTPFAAIDLLLIFDFYSQKDTTTPVVVGIICVLIYLGVAPVLAFTLGLGMIGLVIANSVQLISHALIMLWLLYRRVGAMGEEELPLAIGRIALSSAVMGVVVYLCLALQRTMLPGEGLAARAAWLAAVGLVGAAVYGFSVMQLGVGEARLLLNMVTKRIRSDRGAQGD